MAQMERLTWDEICRRKDLRGRWVALDSCCYDENTGRATEGSVVDADDDLIQLCNRIQDSEWRNCAILFCGDDSAVRAPDLPPPHHPGAH